MSSKNSFSFCENPHLFLQCTYSSFIKTNFDDNISTSTANPITYASLLFETRTVSKIVRKLWRQAENIVLTEAGFGNVDHARIRTQIVDCLHFCVDVPIRKSDRIGDIVQFVDVFDTAIFPWNELHESSLIKLTSSCITNSEKNTPLFSYFHLYLDVRWLSLVIYHESSEVTKCRDHFNAILKDLIKVSLVYYEKVKTKNVLQVTPFLCKCVEQFWLLLDEISRRTNDISFWASFNEIVDKDQEIFNLWLLYHLSMHGVINENYELLERTLKSLNGKAQTNVDDDYLIVLQLTEPMLNIWPVKTEPYQLIWEYFHKHLGHKFGNIANSPQELLQRRSSSYDQFLNMLDRFLQNNPNQWPRIKGRIYSKLPLHKFNELNQTGLYNVIVLFLTLSKGNRFEEVTNKLESLLENLTPERRKSPLVVNTYLALLLLRIQNELSVHEASVFMKDFLDEIADGNENFCLIKLVIVYFEQMLNCTQNFNLDQERIFGLWIKKFIIKCQFSDLCYTVNVFIILYDKIKKFGGWWKWEEMFKQFIMPGLRHISHSSSTPPQVGELVAKINGNSSEILLLFTNENVSAKITCSYLCTFMEELSENHIMPPNQENAIIQAWIRCCLLNIENLEKLTANVTKLNGMFKVFEGELKSTANPIFTFIKELNKKMMQRRYLGLLKDLCETCFGRLDSFVSKHLSSPTSEAVVLHMYTCFALLFFYCSSLIYHKGRSNCLFSKLVNALLLPTEVLMGRCPHPFVLKAIERTWHLFAQGMYSIHDGDPYLERTLRDFVLKYFVHMKTTDSPIVKCFSNEKLTHFLLEKITSAYMSTKTGDDNTRKAFQILRVSLEDGFCAETIVKCTIVPVLESVMFHYQKDQGIDYVKTVCASDFPVNVKQDVRDAVVKITEKHLAFNTNNYFQLIGTLAKIIPDDISPLLSDIKKNVVAVEKMRGVGYDATLRKGFERIETILSSFS